MSARRAAIRRAAADGGIPLYLASLRPVRGRCLRRTRRGVCGARWGVVRVSLDLTEPAAIDRLATVECATCGHTWRRTRVPALTDGAYQTVRLTLILPADHRHWYARGRWHVEGETGVVCEATLADLIAAQDDWRTRNGTYLAARAHAAERRANAEQAAHLATVALLMGLAARDAERATAEAAAAAREEAA